MEKREIGKTGVLLSSVGLGAAPLGGEYGPMEQSTANEIVSCALSKGINYFDTSPFYGRTKSETALGVALRESGRERGEYCISTKVGRYDVESFDFSGPRVTRSVSESLSRLGTEYVDIVIIHDAEFCGPSGVYDPSIIADYNPRNHRCTHPSGSAGSSGNPGNLDVSDADSGSVNADSGSVNEGSGVYSCGAEFLAKETIPALLELKRKGLLKCIGVSGLPLEMLRDVIEWSPVGSIDVVLSYCHLTMRDRSLLDAIGSFRYDSQSCCSDSKNDDDKHVISVITASPLGMGLLSENGPQPWHPASEEIKRACISAKENIDYLNNNDHPNDDDDDRSDNVMSISRTAVEFSISAALDNSRIVSTLIGMSSVDHVDRNVDAALNRGPKFEERVNAAMKALDKARDVSWPSGYYK